MNIHSLSLPHRNTYLDQQSFRSLSVPHEHHRTRERDTRRASLGAGWIVSA